MDVTFSSSETEAEWNAMVARHEAIRRSWRHRLWRVGLFLRRRLVWVWVAQVAVGAPRHLVVFVFGRLVYSRRLRDVRPVLPPPPRL